MEIKDYTRIAWRWWWLIAAATALAAGLSFAVSARLPRVYSATATVLVGQISLVANPKPEDFGTSQQLAQTYVQLVGRQPLLQAALSEIGMPGQWQGVANRVSARVLPGTQLIQISVTGADPELARRITDAVAHQLVLLSPSTVDKDEQQRRDFANQQAFSLQNRIKEAEQEINRLNDRLGWETSARAVQDIQSQIAADQQKIAGWQTTYASLADSVKGSITNHLTLVEPAVPSPQPVSPNIPRNVLIAASIGLLLAIAGVLAIEYVDDTVRDAADVERMLKQPLLGVVTRMKVLEEGRLITLEAADSVESDTYRIIRAALRAAQLPKTGTALLVTSASPGEGKTTTACNLAVSLARSGKRVVLCDADLRLPSVHQRFGLDTGAGLADLLVDGAAPLESALAETSVQGLGILRAGMATGNPSDLLSSDAMTRRLQEMKRQADIVLVDSPAALSVADASALATACDSALLVVRAGNTRVSLIQQAVDVLQSAGLDIVGVVLNRAKGRLPRYRRYYSQARSAPAPSSNASTPAAARSLEPAVQS